MHDTRAALLDAGVRLYGTKAADLLKGLSAGAIAQEAGFHRQTFYRYWDTQAEYLQDLVRHALGTSSLPVADGVAVLPARRTGPLDLDAFARDVARHDFVRVLEDAGARMRIGLLFTGVLADPALSDQVTAYYEGTMERVSSGYEQLLAELGLEPVEGTTTRDLARMLQAMLLGLVVQAMTASDEPHGSVLLERATKTILEGLTQPVAEEGESAAWLR